MKIAILGTGAIGSTFAFQLARNTHDVTVIARGKRLEQLQAEQAIVTVTGGALVDFCHCGHIGSFVDFLVNIQVTAHVEGQDKAGKLPFTPEVVAIN